MNTMGRWEQSIPAAFQVEGRIVFAPEKCAVQCGYHDGKLLMAFRPDPRNSDGLYVELPLAFGLALWHQLTEAFRELMPRRLRVAVVSEPLSDAGDGGALPAGGHEALPTGENGWPSVRSTVPEGEKEEAPPRMGEG